MNPIERYILFLGILFIAQLQAQTAPANNIASGAVMLTIQNESCADNNTATAGTFANATHSGQAFNNNGCLSNQNADSVTEPVDVWYKVEVPSSGAFKMYAEGNYDGNLH